MPTYVYRCKSCEYEFEKVQRMIEESIKSCPECNGEVARVVFPIGVVFKGSGFHINDYPSSATTTKAPEARVSETGSEVKAKEKTAEPAKETVSIGK